MKTKSKVSIDEIEEEVTAGEEVIDKYFDPKSTRVGRPFKSLERRKKEEDVIKTNLDLTKTLAGELDDMADSLNISRQALIKMMIRQSLDNHYIAIRYGRGSKEHQAG